jgi:hypothetical protein
MVARPQTNLTREPSFRIDQRTCCYRLMRSKVRLLAHHFEHFEIKRGKAFRCLCDYVDSICAAPHATRGIRSNRGEAIDVGQDAWQPIQIHHHALYNKLSVFVESDVGEPGFKVRFKRIERLRGLIRYF